MMIFYLSIIQTTYTQILSNNLFPWYYNDGIVDSKDGKGYQFTRVFDVRKGGVISS